MRGNVYNVLVSLSGNSVIDIPSICTRPHVDTCVHGIFDVLTRMYMYLRLGTYLLYIYSMCEVPRYLVIHKRSAFLHSHGSLH